MGPRNPQVTRLVETEAAGWGPTGHGRVWNRHEWVMAALGRLHRKAGHLGAAGTPSRKSSSEERPVCSCREERSEGRATSAGTCARTLGRSHTPATCATASRVGRAAAAQEDALPGGRRGPDALEALARAIEALGPGALPEPDSFSQDVSVPLMPAVTVKIPAHRQMRTQWRSLTAL